MIGLWFLGDFFRLGYYIGSGQAYQFIVGGVLTVLMDSVVLVQFYLYRDNSIKSGKITGKINLIV